MKPVDEMNKDELETYAREKLGFEVDKRRRLDDLIMQVKHIAASKTKPAAEESEKKPKGDRTPKTCRHIKTGVEWPWNPLYSGNADLEIIEWE